MPTRAHARRVRSVNRSGPRAPSKAHASRRSTREERPGTGDRLVIMALKGAEERLGPLWRLPLWAHLGVLVCLLVIVAPAMHLGDSAWVDDEGAYALEVHALNDGDWAFPYPGVGFDSEGEWYPLIRSDHVDDRHYPYIKHPTYVVVQQLATAVFGDSFGFYVVPMLGLALSAAGAWLIAAQIDRRASRPAFWLTAVSPLAVNAYVMWAHTLSAAVGAFTLLAAIRIIRSGPTRWNVLGLGAGLLAGPLLRSEALLFAGAVTFVLGVVLLWRRAVVHAAVVVATGCAAAGAALAVEQRMVSVILGSAARSALPASPNVSGYSLGDIFHERLRAAWRELLNGGAEITPSTEILAWAVVVVAVAALALRFRGDPILVIVGTGLAVGAIGWVLQRYGERFARFPDEQASGFFAAWPVALFGLLAMSWRATGRRERFITGVVLLYALTVVATQYDIAGGGEWGGRFLSPVVPGIAVIIAIGLPRRIADRPWRQRWLVGVAVVLLAVFPMTRGVEVVRRFREPWAKMFAELEATGVDVVIVAARETYYFPALGWSTHDDIDWYVAQDTNFTRLLRELHRQGVREVLVMDTFAENRYYLDTGDYASVDVTPPSYKGLRWLKLDLASAVPKTTKLAFRTSRQLFGPPPLGLVGGLDGESFELGDEAA